MKIAMVKMPLSDYMSVVEQKNDLAFQVSELQQILREVEETTYARHISNTEKIELLDDVVRDYEKYKLALKVCVGWLENTPLRDKLGYAEVVKQAKEALGMTPKQD